MDFYFEISPLGKNTSCPPRLEPGSSHSPGRACN